MKNDYLITQKPLRALLIFAAPMMVGNLFQQAYTMADSAVAGRYVSEQALAAIGASYALTTIFIMFAIGGGNGASVIVSQLFGAKRFREMRLAVRTALLSFLGISLALALFGTFLSRPIMVLLNTPDDVLPMASVYLRIYFMGLPFLFMYNILASMFNALGKSRIPLYFLIFSSLFNIGLDILLVTVFDLGVAGVAWATLIAQGISAVLSGFVLRRQLRQLDDGACPVFSAGQFLSMFRIALPSILQQSTVSIGMMLVQSVVNGFGSQALAGFSAAMRIEGVCAVPMAAVGNSLSPFTAQNIGAEKRDRIPQGVRAGLLIVAVSAAVIALALELFPEPIIGAFLGSNVTAVSLKTGSDCLRFMGWFYGLLGVKFCFDSVLRGAGDMPMFTLGTLLNLGFRVSFAFLMAPRFGIAMVWVAVPLGWIINFIVAYSEYRRGKWRTIRAA